MGKATSRAHCRRYVDVSARFRLLFRIASYSRATIHDHRARLTNPPLFLQPPPPSHTHTGTGTLCDRLTDDIIAHGGEVRLNYGIGTVVCEPVPDKPCPRYCPKCARYSYPKCSLHGPRVLVADAMGRQTRARACIIAVPLNCLPCFKFTPPLSETLKHASEMCNIGEITKSYVLSSCVGAAVDQVQSWPGATLSWVLNRYVDKLNKNTKEYALAAIAKAEPLGSSSIIINQEKDSAQHSHFVTTPVKSALLGKSSRDRGSSRADNKSVSSRSVGSEFEEGEGEWDEEGGESRADDKGTPRSFTFNAGDNDDAGKQKRGPKNEEDKDANEGEEDEDRYDEMSASADDPAADRSFRSPDDKSVSTAPHDDDESLGDDSIAVTESTQSTNTAGALSIVAPGNTVLLDRHDPFTTYMQLAEQGEVRYRGTGLDGDLAIGSVKDEREKVEEEFDQHGYKVRAYAILGVVGPPDQLGDKGQKLAPMLRKHHPTSRLHKIISHNWQRDRHLRGSQMAIRAGSTHLFAKAVDDARRPWETKNLMIAGSDVTDLWTGWLEGAVCSGRTAAEAITAFLNPPVPVANFTGKYYPGADPRRT